LICHKKSHSINLFVINIVIITTEKINPIENKNHHIAIVNTSHLLSFPQPNIYIDAKTRLIKIEYKFTAMARIINLRHILRVFISN